MNYKSLSQTGQQASRACLITSLGTTDYQEASYSLLDGSTIFRTRFAPLATAMLVPELAHADIVFLATATAQKKWRVEVDRELAQGGRQATWHTIPEGASRQELEEAFEALCQAVPKGAKVALDVTCAMRHMPFLWLTTAAYIVGLEQADLLGLYYAVLDPRDRYRFQIADLSFLVELLQWYQALQSFRETGSAQALDHCLSRHVRALFQSNQGNPLLGRIRNRMKQFASSLAAGLPLETGLAACALLDELRGEAANSLSGPAGRMLRFLVQELELMALPEKQNGKTEMVLSHSELERQLRVISWYAGHGESVTALGNLREWLVNLVLWWQGKTTDWLSLEVRRKAERLLGAQSYRARLGYAAGQHAAWVRLWDQVSQKRNVVAHCGMRPDRLSEAQLDLCPELESARALLSERPPSGFSDRESRIARSGALLVTPLGLSPGVLYSAVKLVQPTKVLILTSREGANIIGEALTHAGAADIPRRVVTVEDPFRGFREIPALLKDCELRQELALAPSLLANITGGTTALQHLCERLAAEAERLGIPCRRFALIDPRPPDEQKRNPYVCGEIYWLDDVVV